MGKKRTAAAAPFVLLYTEVSDPCVIRDLAGCGWRR